jgi:hypothetical protein
LKYSSTSLRKKLPKNIWKINWDDGKILYGHYLTLQGNKGTHSESHKKQKAWGRKPRAEETEKYRGDEENGPSFS